MPSATSRIIAVIVTHDRRVLLERCLDALERQSRRPDAFVVIDNGSTDDTVAMLGRRGVRYVSQANVGSAGGWHRGIQIAIEEGFDAVWLMDDDGYPAETALEFLEPALQGGVSCVSSVVLCEDDRDRLVFPLPLLDARGLPRIMAIPRKLPSLGELLPRASKGLFPFAHLFNGALVSTAAVRAVGNVNRDFFIFGDELDYLYRLRTFGPVYTVVAAHHYHPDVSARPLSDAKIYYYVKNTIILNNRYFDWALVRSVLTVAAAIARAGRRNGWSEAMSYLVGRKSHVLRTAISRGFHGVPAQDFHG